MDGFTKLHAKIVTSTIWDAPDHVRLMFITLLAIADQDGNIEGSPGSFAAIARVSKEQARDAFEVLMSPDPDSTDGTDGVRIEQLTSGVYHIKNHKHYRSRQTRRQAMQARYSATYRERKKARKEREPSHDADASSESSIPVYVYREEGEPPALCLESGAQTDAAPSKGTSVNKQGALPGQNFDDWWAWWPSGRYKTGKADAQKAWVKLKPSERAAAIADIPERARLWEKYGTDMQFQKRPATFLRSKLWMDPLPEAEPDRRSQGRTETPVQRLDRVSSEDGYYQPQGDED